MRKWFVAGAFLLVAASALLGFSQYLKTHMEERNAVIEARSRLEAEAKKVSAVKLENAWTKLNKLRDLEELEEFAEKVMPVLSKGEREALIHLLRAKLFEANFRRAELYLLRAGDLLRADNNHPTGKEYIERAWKLYMEMEKLMEQGIPERAGDVKWNARLNYLKGVYWFGLAKMTFIRAKDPRAETARLEELIDLSAKHLSAVYQYIVRSGEDGDQFWRTDVAIEILQKTAASMAVGKDSNDPNQYKLKLLPSSGSQPGPTFAIEGLKEGRH